MAQEVKIAGAVFSDVPEINVPDSQDNYHPFMDVSDTTATAGDVATGKYFYAADGTRTAGEYSYELPVGTVIDFAGNTVPSGYLECNGQAVSRTTYALLFAAIGTTWGAGDGSTTFNLPDFRGRVSIGAGTGTAGGATAHSMASYGGDERMPAHSHGNTIKATTPKFTHSIDTTNGNKNLIGAGSQTSIGAAGASGTKYTYKQISIGDHAATACTMSGSVSSEGSGTAGNMQPFAALRKIIRAV